MAPESDTETRAALPTALACLALIGRQLGLEVTEAQLTGGAMLPPGPLSTAQVVAGARRAGLQSKVLHIGFEELASAEPFLPAIVRLRDGSCMVLLALRRDSDVPTVVLQDPHAEADTPLVLDRFRFERAWTGDLILVRRRREAGAGGFGWPLVRRLLAQEKPLLRDLALSTLALGFVAVLPVLFVQLLVSRVFGNGLSSTLTVLCLGFLVAAGVETALGALRRYIVARLTARIEAKLATTLLDRLLAMPLGAVQRLSRGGLSHKVDQLARLQAPATADLLATFLDAGLLVFVLPLMLFLSPVLTTAVLLAGAVAGGLIARRLPALRVAIVNADAAAERRAAFQTEVVAGVRTVKSLALDVAQRRHWRRLSDDLSARRQAVARLSAGLQAFATGTERVLVTGSLALGLYLSAIGGHVAAIGALIAFYLLVQRLAAPLLGLARLAEQGEAIRSTADTLAALVGPGEEPRPATGSTAALRGQIAFDKVSFRYPGAAVPALREVTFQCPAGLLLGVMGRSGSGKSTLASLLQRLHGEHRGTITVDGSDIRDFDPTHLRRMVVVVPQDAFIFGGTIRENITAARISASFEEVTTAARLSGADEFIDALPRGYETTVLEGAPTLSSGQRQRLALARALIANPRILVLDEALSALDGDVETRVLANLRAMAGERTIILVSHRLSALMAADAVMVLEDGRVHDFGRHAELIERSELYSHQWHRERVPADGDPQTERLLALS